VVSPAGQQPLHHVRTSRGGEVEILAPPAEQNVPDRAAHQGDFVPGVGEPATELVDDRRDPQQ
jgi:hypothetical protein